MRPDVHMYLMKRYCQLICEHASGVAKEKDASELMRVTHRIMNVLEALIQVDPEEHTFPLMLEAWGIVHAEYVHNAATQQVREMH